MMGADPVDLFKGKRRSNDPRLDVVLPLLLRRCCALRKRGDTSRGRVDVEREIAREMKTISQALGNGLLRYISTAFVLPLRDQDRIASPYCHSLCPDSRLARCASHHRRIDTLSAVQEIKTLKVKLDATTDEDEQRVLEEDIAGKILWFCWCGICAEVKELLPKVVSYIWKEGGLKESIIIHTTHQGLFEIDRKSVV